MCDITDHDPESGIDGPTASKLLSRKRASGSSVEVQWKEIWNLLFPDDEDHDIKPFGELFFIFNFQFPTKANVSVEFCPVIEHFELQAQFMATLINLQQSLCNKGLKERTVETIDNIYRNGFIHVMEQCKANAQSLPYTNRSNKKNEGQSVTASKLENQIGDRPRPDSGVVVDDASDDGSGTQSVAQSTWGVYEPSVLGSEVGGHRLYHSDSLKTVRNMNASMSAAGGFRTSMQMQQGALFGGLASQPIPEGSFASYPAPDMHILAGTGSPFMGGGGGQVFTPEPTPEAWGNVYNPQGATASQGFRALEMSQGHFEDGLAVLNGQVPPGWNMDAASAPGEDFTAFREFQGQ
jgi:hypothetical protein